MFYGCSPSHQSQTLPIPSQFDRHGKSYEEGDGCTERILMALRHRHVLLPYLNGHRATLDRLAKTKAQTTTAESAEKEAEDAPLCYHLLRVGVTKTILHEAEAINS